MRPAVEKRSVPTWALLLLVVLIGVNVRASFGAVPPLIGEIGHDLSLSATAQALLTSVPIVCMGLFAPVAQRLAARLGPEPATSVLLALLCVGGITRLWATSVALLFLSAVVSGAGMGGASALVPALIGRHLRRLSGRATGLYSTAMASGVGLAAWIAGPTAVLLHGWRPALALWGVAAGLTMLYCLALLPRLSADGQRSTRPPSRHRGLPWRSPTARWVTVFYTFHILVGFSAVAWITPAYTELGFPAQRAAGLFVLFQAIQLVAMLSLPTLTDYTRDRRPMLGLTLSCICAGLAAMVVAPSDMAVPAVLLFGIGVGGGSSLSLVLIVDAADNDVDAARLGAMVLLVGFLAGAGGPLLLGMLRDWTGGFTAGFATLLTLALAALAAVPVLRPSRTVTDVNESEPGGAMATRG